jgi:hypothetical protein
MRPTIPRQSRRFILNVIEGVAHDRTRLSERCNTDDIVKKRMSETVPKSYRLCEICGGESAYSDSNAGFKEPTP